MRHRTGLLHPSRPCLAEGPSAECFDGSLPRHPPEGGPGACPSVLALSPDQIALAALLPDVMWRHPTTTPGVNLLASGHEEQGFRYLSLKGGAIPDLSWTREIVDLLIQSLREVVVDDEGSDEAVKVQILVGKPYERPKGS